MKANYKNWVPEKLKYGMLAVTLVLLIATILCGIFTSGTVRIVLLVILIIGCAVMAKFTQWCFAAYNAFSYDGDIQLSYPFLGHVKCKYGRTRKGDCISWSCLHKQKCYGATCKGSANINEKRLRAGFVIAWNSVVQEREQHLPRWKEMKENGTALEKLRAKQMTELTAAGEITMEQASLIFRRL